MPGADGFETPLQDLALFQPVPRGKARATPLERLQRRYADGEISTEEYEERKKRLEKDAPKP